MLEFEGYRGRFGIGGTASGNDAVKMRNKNYPSKIIFGWAIFVIEKMLTS